MTRINTCYTSVIDRRFTAENSLWLISPLEFMNPIMLNAEIRAIDIDHVPP